MSLVPSSREWGTPYLSRISTRPLYVTGHTSGKSAEKYTLLQRDSLIICYAVILCFDAGLPFTGAWDSLGLIIVLVDILSWTDEFHDRRGVSVFPFDVETISEYTE